MAQLGNGQLEGLSFFLAQCPCRTCFALAEISSSWSGILGARMKAKQASLSASQQLIARCVVAFHFGMWSWGMWIALVVACFFHKISAALMTL